MKPEKAIWHYMALKEDYLSRKSFISREKIDEISKEVIRMLEKQIPKKPIKTVNAYNCFRCGKNLAFKDDYCGTCGQKLDWGE